MNLVHILSLRKGVLSLHRSGVGITINESDLLAPFTISTEIHYSGPNVEVRGNIPLIESNLTVDQVCNFLSIPDLVGVKVPSRRSGGIQKPKKKRSFPMTEFQFGEIRLNVNGLKQTFVCSILKPLLVLQPNNVIANSSGIRCSYGPISLIQLEGERCLEFTPQSLNSSISLASLSCAVRIAVSPTSANLRTAPISIEANVPGTGCSQSTEKPRASGKRALD
jgi:hypothetical protein